MAAPTTDLVITRSLIDDPRNSLKNWLEAVEYLARTLCAAWDISGALTLVASDDIWRLFPGNITNLADVLANGDAPNIRARPTWDAPAAHANNAASAVISIFRQANDKHQAYIVASSMLAKALLVSIGDVNETLIRTTFVDVPIYAVTPRQIVDTMRAEYGVPTGDDVKRLREPFKVPLSAIADLNLHMSRFLLASTELDKSGQGERPYRYFEMFLETMQGFSGIGLALSTFYARYPAIADQTMGTLFPFLREQRPYLLSQAQASPFSGSATPALAPASPGNKKGKNNGGRNQNRRDRRRQYGNGPSWGPNGPTALAAGSSSSAIPTPEHAGALNEITRLQTMLAGLMSNSTGYGAYKELPVPPPIPVSVATSLSTEGRVRPYYCWLHGHNNSHNGISCKVMANNPAYTEAMKA